MVNQTYLNIIPIKFQILRAKFSLKCPKMINFVEEFKNTSNLMKKHSSDRQQKRTIFVRFTWPLTVM